MAANTDIKASLEITKGATAIEPIPIVADSTDSIHDEGSNLLGPFPTEEEWGTLPRVAGRIPWQAWTVAAVEFVERFSYYGTSAVFVSKQTSGTCLKSVR
jgi:POT family proton-dependent oligopeptide transporter